MRLTRHRQIVGAQLPPKARVTTAHQATYASASPATDGPIVFAWFGSQWVYSYDLRGLRWTVDLGRVDMRVDIPVTNGGASSPIIVTGGDRPGDTHADSFLLSLDAIPAKRC